MTAFMRIPGWVFALAAGIGLAGFVISHIFFPRTPKGPR